MSTDEPMNELDPNDPLRAAWVEQEIEMTANLFFDDPALFANSAAEAHRKDQRQLIWLNIREVLPSLVVSFVFLVMARESTHPWALVVAGILPLLVAAFLVTSSLTHRSADQQWGESVRAQLDRRLAQLNHRVWMYRNAVWWYFLPLMVSFSLVIYGLGASLVQFGLITVGYALFSLVLHRLTRRKARSEYELEAAKLENLLTDLDRAS